MITTSTNIRFVSNNTSTAHCPLHHVCRHSLNRSQRCGHPLQIFDTTANTNTATAIALATAVGFSAASATAAATVIFLCSRLPSVACLTLLSVFLSFCRFDGVAAPISLPVVLLPCVCRSAKLFSSTASAYCSRQSDADATHLSQRTSLLYWFLS